MMKTHSFVRENVPRVLTWAKDKTCVKFSYFASVFSYLFLILFLIFQFILFLHLLCVPNVINMQYFLSTVGPSPVVPQVSQYLYFLFAPTLIYRDKYPR